MSCFVNVSMAVINMGVNEEIELLDLLASLKA